MDATVKLAGDNSKMRLAHSYPPTVRRRPLVTGKPAGSGTPSTPCFHDTPCLNDTKSQGGGDG